MSNLSDILKSFHLQDELNPKIWGGSSDTPKMNPKVRTRLLEIVNDFMEFLDVDIVVSDIIMTGSLANYNWSKFSDVDIHILADFDQFSDEERPLYDELFYLKKSVYNDKHNITIFGYDVELYIEDESAKKDVKNIGTYSIMNNEWVSKPTKDSVDINYDRISDKAKQWMKTIDGVVDNTKDEEIETAKNIIKKYNDKIRKFRESGLQKGGEYSEENLVFKILRRNGYLEKIRGLKDKLVDKRLSLKERNQQMIKK
jgi:predicted nucleotidyltransferase